MNITIDLVPYENDGLEFLIDKNTGEVWSTIHATARIVERNESTIRYFLTARKIELKSAQVQTATGFKTARILGEELLFDVCRKYKPRLLWLFARMGLRVYLRRLAGCGASVDLDLMPKAEDLRPDFKTLTEEVNVLQHETARMCKLLNACVLLDLNVLTLRVAEFDSKLKGLTDEHGGLAVGKLAGKQLNLELKPKAEELETKPLETKSLETKYTVAGRLKERGLEKIASGVGRIGARARALYVNEAGEKAGEQERVYVRCAKFATYVYAGEELRFVDLAIDERLMKLGLYGDLMSSSLVKV